MSQADGTLNETLTSNVTRIFTPDVGLTTGALFLMAIIPIYIGAHKSIKALKESLEPDATDITVFRRDEAVMLPIYASCALFGIFLVFKIFAAEHINMLLSIYALLIGTYTVFFLIRSYAVRLFPRRLRNTHFTLILTESESDAPIPQKESGRFQFERRDAVPLAIALSVGLVYVCSKHWVANNIISIAIAIAGIEHLHLDRAINGCVLLCGLFVYDVFWVFGTGVMVFVATNFDAPVKVVFPRDFLTNGFFSKDVGILGLGDIVVPGIFLALLLRFDNKLDRNGSRFYFWTGYVAYIIGLLATFAVLYIFRHAQPALLYLVPTCLGFPLAMALIKGDFNELMAYKDIPLEVEERLGCSIPLVLPLLPSFLRIFIDLPVLSFFSCGVQLLVFLSLVDALQNASATWIRVAFLLL
ncbi:Minor histocompatibility antigen H13 [Echinococcus multilocularis]|uniref:Minor histocompatibility antigen H13 n=1 Tax=Echinococcus multilocularis TaxID=6211 RepID=A0A087VY03_ECHMU|nr:Minor histocompatibility antigen H13 [Echinococcus multilocularis]